jgi:hypothetical protein
LSTSVGQQRLDERAARRHLLAEQEVEPVARVRDRDRRDSTVSSGACARSRPVVSP